MDVFVGRENPFLNCGFVLASHGMAIKAFSHHIVVVHLCGVLSVLFPHQSVDDTFHHPWKIV